MDPVTTYSAGAPRAWRRWWPQALVALALAVLATLGGAHAQGRAAPAEPPSLTRLAEALAEARNGLAAALTRLQLDGEARAMASNTHSPIHSFSADVMLESLYRRAEAAQTGEGERFLALLYHDAAGRSAAIRDDAVLRPLGQKYPKAKAMATPIRFAPAASVATADARAPLPPAATRAITTLADFHAAKGMASMKASALRTFGKPGFDSREFDRALMESANPEQALRQLLARGTPPPRAEAAVHQLLNEAIGLSAALRNDAHTRQLMEELSREISPEQRRYTEVENELASRQAQVEESEKKSFRGQVAPSSERELLAGWTRPGDGAPPAEPGKGTDPGPTGPGLSGGDGGASPGQSHFDRNASNYRQYDRDTFEPHTPSSPSPRDQAGPPRTPRAFNTARVSARAGRGVSVGAPVRSEVRHKIVSASWVSNPEDDRFGRLFLNFVDRDSGQAGLAVSRPMFSDSFGAAADVLWKQAPGSAGEFRPGNILVLMSMDPTATQRWLDDLERQAQALILSATREGEQDRLSALLATVRDENSPLSERDAATEKYLALLESINERIATEDLERLEEAQARLEYLRAIVLHPALAGRELAWSVTRVDFWTNQPEALVKEARQVAPSSRAPAAFDELPTLRATTWQYHQRSAVVRLGPPQKGVRPLTVTSQDGSPSTRSHFSIAMFSPDAGPEGIEKEDDLYLRPDAARTMQPLLDWLATRHHDYMRLNDFSESFMLLRWLHSQRVDVTLLDLRGGLRPAIAIPDRVDLRTGPKAGD